MSIKSAWLSSGLIQTYTNREGLQDSLYKQAKGVSSTVHRDGIIFQGETLAFSRRSIIVTFSCLAMKFYSPVTALSSSLKDVTCETILRVNFRSHS